MRRVSHRLVLSILILVAACSRDSGKIKREAMTNGDQFTAKKQYAEAIIEYRKSVALDRYNASTLNRLGLVLSTRHASANLTYKSW